MAYKCMVVWCMVVWRISAWSYRCMVFVAACVRAHVCVCVSFLRPTPFLTLTLTLHMNMHYAVSLPMLHTTPHGMTALYDRHCLRYNTLHYMNGEARSEFLRNFLNQHFFRLFLHWNEDVRHSFQVTDIFIIISNPPCSVYLPSSYTELYHM